MKLSELKDGQRIKELDDLLYIDLVGEQDSYSTEDCYTQLTGNHLKQMTKIASVEQIGKYNKEMGSIVFEQIKPNGEIGEEEYIFLDRSENGKIDLELFELVV